MGECTNTNILSHVQLYSSPWPSTFKTHPPLFVFFCFFRAKVWHLEVSKLGVKSELQLLADATATAMWDLGHVCNPQHSLQQGQLLNPVSEARD